MKFKVLLFVTLAFGFTACGGGGDAKEETPEAVATPEEVVAEEVVVEKADPLDNIGIGPITTVDFGEEVDVELAAIGKAVFEIKCTACHKPTERHVGPSLAGVYQRRNPVWVMNMLLNPNEMVEKDPVAKQLLSDYASHMADQNLTEDEARQIAEYLRTIEVPEE